MPIQYRVMAILPRARAHDAASLTDARVALLPINSRGCAMCDSAHHALVNSAEWRGILAGSFARGRASGAMGRSALEHAECASRHGL
jgi:hypothetical protein